VLKQGEHYVHTWHALQLLCSLLALGLCVGQQRHTSGTTGIVHAAFLLLYLLYHQPDTVCQQHVAGGDKATTHRAAVRW
jgi:hypothetical protein